MVNQILPATSQWVAAVDKKSKKTYYYNKKTRKSRWTNPDCQTASGHWLSADKSTGETYRKTSEASWEKQKGQTIRLSVKRNSKKSPKPSLKHDSSLSSSLRAQLAKNPKPTSCNICGKSFTTYPQLKQHDKIHTKRIKCTYCVKLFRDNFNLHQHLSRKHHREQQDENFQTVPPPPHSHTHNKSAKTEAGNSKHIDSPEAVAPQELHANRYSQSKSTPLLSDEDEEEQPVGQHHPETSLDIVITCTHCNTPNKIRLPKGNEKWATITTKCGGCEKQFETRNPNFGNVARVNFTEKLECKFCDIPPLSKEKLAQHVRRRHEYQGPFFCKSCAGKFKFLALFRKHRCRQWECDVCGLVFAFEGVFNEHLALHGERPFSCSLCERDFKNQTGLRTHRRTHMDESDKEFMCTQCPKRFFTKTRLTQHLRGHSGEKPEVCCVCKEGFAVRHKMLAHQKKCFEVHKKPNERLVKRRVKKKIIWEVMTFEDDNLEEQHNEEGEDEGSTSDGVSQLPPKKKRKINLISDETITAVD